MALIEVTGVSKSYTTGDETVAALRGIDFSIAEGEFVTIMGRSGSGKSTLLSVLGGLNRPTGGTVTIAGVDLYALPGERLADFRSQRMGFVFQSFNLIPYLTALENVMLPLAISPWKPAEKQAAAREALDRVGLSGKGDRLPSQISGGEQERVAIARAIVNRPAILFADEPTGNLDTGTSNRMMELFRSLNEGGQTVVMVTHNPENCSYAERTIHIRDGVVEAIGQGGGGIA